MKTRKDSQQFIELLQKLESAWTDLTIFFTETDEDGDYAQMFPNLYPFQYSFDEHLSPLRRWTGIQIKVLNEEMEDEQVKGYNENAIIEGNRRIAEFMGISPRLIRVDMYGLSFEHDSFTGHTPEDVWSYASGSLKYHTSWDWLMPVVNACYLFDMEESLKEALKMALMDAKIQKVWNVVVRFLNTFHVS